MSHAPTARPTKGKNAPHNLPNPAHPSVPVLPRGEQPARTASHNRRAMKTLALVRLCFNPTLPQPCCPATSSASLPRESTRWRGCPDPAGFPPWKLGVLHKLLGPDPGCGVPCWMIVLATAGCWATQAGLVGKEGMEQRGAHRSGCHQHRGRCCTQAIPSPFLQGSWLTARGFGILPLLYQFLWRMNHPDNYFCLNLCFLSKLRMLRHFLTLGDFFFGVVDSSQRKYNYSLRFSTETDLLLDT